MITEKKTYDPINYDTMKTQLLSGNILTKCNIIVELTLL